MVVSCRPLSGISFWVGERVLVSREANRTRCNTPWGARFAPGQTFPSDCSRQGEEMSKNTLSLNGEPPAALTNGKPPPRVTLRPGLLSHEVMETIDLMPITIHLPKGPRDVMTGAANHYFDRLPWVVDCSESSEITCNERGEDYLSGTDKLRRHVTKHDDYASTSYFTAPCFSPRLRTSTIVFARRTKAPRKPSVYLPFWMEEALA